MKLRLIAQDGIKFTEVIDYALIQNTDGQFVILDKHIPVITSLDYRGYIKLVQQGMTSFIVVDRATIIFRDSMFDIYALHAQIGNTIEQANEALLREQKSMDNLAKSENIDFSRQEKELRENIMRSQAGRV